MRSVAVTWGAATEAELLAGDPEVLVNSPEELPAVFRSLGIVP
jgi:phosphoglycolate phosphatase-like HAD superfamily hydrolase